MDESGEDHLYPAGRFIAIDLPDPLKRAMLKKASYPTFAVRGLSDSELVEKQ